MLPIEKISALPLHHRETIPPDYLDVFGHMNIQYYMALFNNSIFSMSETIAMGLDYFQGEDRGMYALEHHVKYLAEVRAGESVALYSRFFARSEKRLHLMHFMVNETRGVLAATLEMVAMHIDRVAGRSMPFPDHIAAVIDARIAADTQLDWEAPLSAPLRP